MIVISAQQGDGIRITDAIKLTVSQQPAAWPSVQVLSATGLDFRHVVSMTGFAAEGLSTPSELAAVGAALAARF